MQRNLNLVVKSRMPPEATAGALRRAIAKLDPDAAMFDVHTMAERTSLSVTSRRGMVVLAAVFGGLALFLSAVGLYGALAYVVVQRTREFGIRLALGATAHHILSLVVHEGFVLTAIGLGLGLVGAAAMRRIIERQIYGVSPLEPTVVAGVVALFSIVGLVACLLPARRATRVDPIVVLNVL
ncbi:MAG TPA: FtsX-like permease family protein [Vicinamibacterales bacterium]|nr:FtsX-like permease family protein [Vicinamibacterales bacterium]